MTEMQSKTFKPGDLVRWIGEWPFPLVDAPPRENTVLAIETDGKVRLEGRHGNEAPQRWWCPPSQLVHREPVQATTLEVVNDDASLKARFAALAVRLRDAADTYSESPPIFGLFFEAAEALDDAIKVDADLADAFDTNSKIAERLRSIMSTCFDGSRSGDLMFQLADMEKWVPKFTSEWKANHRRWLELCTRLGLDALDLEQRGRVAEVDAVAGEALELKRIRSIVDGDARKRHGDREGEPSWGVIADCVLAHVSQHRQAKKILDVPDHVTLDQAATVVRGVVDDAAATRLILEASLGRIPDPARSTVQLAREVVDQTERWRIDAEHYRSEASNATAQHVEALSAEVAMLTGEVAATRSEAKRQIDSALARKHLLPGLSNGASLARIELNLQEVVRSLARMELRQDGKIEIVERVLAADTRPMARLQVSAMDVATSISPPVFATELRHVLADKLREAAKVAVAWEEAAIREWEPLAAGYHDGDGTVTAAIEGQYIEHRLVMAWRGQVQRMAENLSADESPPTPIQRLDYTTLPLGYTTEADAIADAWIDYKAHNDPPGLEVTDDGLVGWGFQVFRMRTWPTPGTRPVREFHIIDGGQQPARAAAWAWYDRRLAVHARVADDPRHRIDFCGSCGAENEPQDDDECPACGSTSCLISTWGEQQAERYRTSERYTANDPSIDDASPTWPCCLTWSDAQVAEVERWLADSTAEMPEVLRG